MKKENRGSGKVVLTKTRVSPNNSICSHTLILFLQGWTKFYEFAFGDLRAGADIIDRLCTAAGKNYTLEAGIRNFRTRYPCAKNRVSPFRNGLFHTVCSFYKQDLFLESVFRKLRNQVQ